MAWYTVKTRVYARQRPNAVRTPRMKHGIAGDHNAEIRAVLKLLLWVPIATVKVVLYMSEIKGTIALWADHME